MHDLFNARNVSDSEGFSTFISGFSRMFDGFSMDVLWIFDGFSAAGRIHHPAGPVSGASQATSAFPAKRPWRPWSIAAR